MNGKEKSHRAYQIAVSRRKGYSGSARRSGSRSSWRQRSAVCPAVQRQNQIHGTRIDYSGCHYRVFGQIFYLHSQDPSRGIKKAIGIDKGSGEPHKNKVGKLSKAKLEEIAKLKAPDLSAIDVDGAMKIIAGTARSMGVEVEG